jgi:glucokinase
MMMMSAATTSKHPLAIGIDIGGTKMVAGLVNTHHFAIETLKTVEVPTPNTHEAFIKAIAELAVAVCTSPEQALTLPIGISTAGVVNVDTGSILGSSSNLKAVDHHPYPIGRYVATALGRAENSIHVENDANSAIVGEQVLGAGRGHQNVVMVTLGTGVGGGAIIDGKLLRGSNFSATEVGHASISFERRPIQLKGEFGSWEAYASGSGFRYTLQKELFENQNKPEAQAILKGRNITDITSHDGIAALKEGNVLAKKVHQLWLSHVTSGVASLLNIFDPEIMVIGGGMAKFVDFPLLTSMVRERVVSPIVNTPIVQAELGNWAGLVGGACLALKH